VVRRSPQEKKQLSYDRDGRNANQTRGPISRSKLERCGSRSGAPADQIFEGYAR
jgi:hypothetical protein